MLLRNLSQLPPSYLPVNPSEVRDLRGRNWEQGDYWFSVHDEGPEKYPNKFGISLNLYYLCKGETNLYDKTMEKKTKFVTMGEIMLRMTRPDYQRIIQGNKIDGFFGGSEANVAVSLAMMGDNVEYVTRLPNNMLGVACRNELRRYHVGTNHIIWGGSRVGKYFWRAIKGLSQQCTSCNRSDKGSQL